MEVCVYMYEGGREKGRKRSRGRERERGREGGVKVRKFGGGGYLQLALGLASEKGNERLQ